MFNKLGQEPYLLLSYSLQFLCQSKLHLLKRANFPSKIRPTSQIDKNSPCKSNNLQGEKRLFILNSPYKVNPLDHIRDEYPYLTRENSHCTKKKSHHQSN